MNEHAKILLATQTINFLSARLQVIIQDLEHIPCDQHPMTAQLLGRHYVEMNGVIQGLKNICENFGDYMNDCDAVDDIDQKVTAAAFEYL